MTSDGVSYNYEMTYCNGTAAAIIASTSCTVPISVLLAAPFNLPWGSSIYAQVMAYNSYGDSDLSTAGNGAVITTNPSPPFNLQDVTSMRTPTSLTIMWS